MQVSEIEWSRVLMELDLRCAEVRDNIEAMRKATIGGRHRYSVEELIKRENRLKELRYALAAVRAAAEHISGVREPRALASQPASGEQE